MGRSPMVSTRDMLKVAEIENRIVERYHPKSKKYPFGCSEDFMNIIDLIALEGEIVGYQVCGEDWSQHIRKLTEDEAENTIKWLSQGVACPGCGLHVKTTRLVLIGWRKVKKKRGGKLKVWRPRIADIFLDGGRVVWKERKKR